MGKKSEIQWVRMPRTIGKDAKVLDDMKVSKVRGGLASVEDFIDERGGRAKLDCHSGDTCIA